MSEEEQTFLNEVYKFTISHEFTEKWAKSCKPGWSIAMQTFEIRTDDIVTRWQVEVFPNGTSDQTKNHMSVFLCLKSASSHNFFAKFFSRIFNIKFKKALNFNVHFVLGIVAKHGTIVYDKQFDCKGQDFEDACGSHDFIDHKRLFKKENHIPDGKLTVSCQISLKPMIPQIDYKKLFRTKSNTDLVLICNDGKSHKVHREVLVKKAPDFFLSIDWNNNVGTISDFNYKTVNELLRFVYYGEVENMKKIAGDLVRASRKYKLPELDKICSEFLVSE